MEFPTKIGISDGIHQNYMVVISSMCHPGYFSRPIIGLQSWSLMLSRSKFISNRNSIVKKMTKKNFDQCFLSQNLSQCLLTRGHNFGQFVLRGTA